MATYPITQDITNVDLITLSGINGLEEGTQYYDTTNNIRYIATSNSTYRDIWENIPDPLLNILNQIASAQIANLWIDGSAIVGTINGLIITNNGTNTLNIAAGQSLIVPAGGTLGTAAYTNSTAYEVPLTFSNGLTRIVNTVKNNLITGRTGGQTIYGGTLTAEILNIRSNVADLTTGSVKFLDTLEASSSTIGAVTMAGGLAVAKRLWTTDLTSINLPTLGGVVLTTTMTKLNYLTSVTGITGTATGKVVLDTAPTFVTSITTPSVLATTNDSGALGASGTAFSDLFLASGGVINWDAGNVTLTHTANTLSLNALLNLTDGVATTGGYSVQNIQLPVNIAVGAGLSTRQLANNSIIQFGNNYQETYTGPIDSSLAGVMIRLDTRDGTGSILYGGQGYTLFQIQTRVAGTTTSEIPFQMMAAPSGSFIMNMLGNIGLGILPTARITLKAGTATVNTSPLKLTQTSAIVLTIPEAGAIECNDGDLLYYTIKTGPTRKTIAFTDSAITSSVYIGTTSVALNRGSGALVLTGITSIDGTAAKATNLVGGVLGSIPYQSGVDTTSMLSPNITTTRKVLTQTGTGAIGAAPVWEEIDIILAQGLNWNSSTDVYTRLGSLSAISVGTSAGNSYLPIQSSMKRCLTSDAGVVNYYIDSTNPICKDGTTVLLSGTTDSTSAGHLMNSTGDFITNGVLVGMYVKNTTDSTYAMITAVAAADLTIGLDIMVSGETYQIGTALYDGTDGQVVTEVPKFYYKQGVNTNDHYWYISKYKLTGFTLHPAFWKDGKEVDYRYYSSFEGSMYDDSAGAMCSAANVPGNIYTAGDKLCSVANQWAKTNETRTSYRAMAQARSAAYRDHDYYLLSAIQLLYLIEYASFNSQVMIGGGRTNLTGGGWTADSYIGRTGFSVKDGNNTANVSIGGTSYMIDYMTYRGIENFFGNVWKFIDGITWDSTLNDTTSPIPVYVTNNSAYFKDSGSANMQLLCNATNIGGTNAGYSKNIENATGFIPSAIGGSSTTYLTDYYYQYSSNGNNWRAPCFGSDSISGSDAGAFTLDVNFVSGSLRVYLGSRLCL